ncbi:hypothetical protein L2449_10655 [Mesorhizobium muleiense]|uniref:hypothetical protein n=1 Tax=Mesorhizobium muleiense TaxID=1004279 RepID=UPI001F24705B|nr:hypothetical protein [Mesorhizobium muleiense]MCF6117364.1 hypothetical protein [Mesorhizobium muleiense]
MVRRSDQSDTRERSDTERFTADTAARTGQSERTVQRNIERGEKVIDEVAAGYRSSAAALEGKLDASVTFVTTYEDMKLL